MNLYLTLFAPQNRFCYRITAIAGEIICYSHKCSSRTEYLSIYKFLAARLVIQILHLVIMYFFQLYIILMIWKNFMAQI